MLENVNQIWGVSMKTRRMFSRESGPNPFSMRTVRMATVILLVALLAGPARASPSLISPARLLVIAPHPDDETLAAGGLIYSASKQGAKVKVVFITMGDGYHLAASALRDIACPSPDDFLALGNHRRKEGIAALAALGVSDRDVVFLGYPDRGLANIIDNWHWSPDEPYTSAHTGRSSNPYPSTFTPGAQYCVSQIVSDLVGILNDYMPDMVILPHPNDTHDDHHATYALSMFAIQHLNLMERTDAKVLCYIVHSGPKWPEPWGYQPDSPLDPPPWRDQPRLIWHRLELSHEARDAKLQALEEYGSQVALMPSFLKSFIKTNELFANVPTIVASCDHDEAQAHEDDGGEVGPTLQHLRLFQPSGEITSVVADPTDEGIAVTATFAWRPSSSIVYRLRIMHSAPSLKPDPTINVLAYDITPEHRQSEPWEVSFLIPLHDLDRLGTKFLFEVVTMQRSAVVDRSGWILLLL